MMDTVAEYQVCFKKRKGEGFMKKKMLCLAFAVMVSVAFAACGSSDKDAEETKQEEVKEETQTEEDKPDEEDVTKSKAEPVKVSSYEDIAEIYQFELEGTSYQLPSAIDTFINNGCTIDDRFLSETVEANHSLGQIIVHPDGDEDKYIELTVLNDTENAMTVQECQKVIRVTVREDSNVSFILNSGIDVLADDTEIEDLEAVYGTDEKVYDRDDEGVTWHFCQYLEDESDGTMTIYSMLQPGTDAMCVYAGGFYIEYISPEE